MRYGIFADVHANWEALQAVLQAYRHEGIDEHLCIGDIVGYASNPGECIEAVKPLARVVVAGNHDWASVDLFSLQYFNTYAKDAITWTREELGKENKKFLESLELIYNNKDLTIVHSSLDAPGDFNYITDCLAAGQTFKLLKTKVCFIGHVHVPGVFVKDARGISYRQAANTQIKDDNTYIVNVGSVGQPRDGNPDASYCIYDTAVQRVEIKRVAYDVRLARKKIIEAGLPAFLGERLLTGR